MSSPNPSVPVNVGQVLLGKYVVERVIGAGGMGVVVAVRHRDLGELYAMKFMLPSALENAQAVDRFVREARAAARLKSEHVASVTDVGRLENGSPYMVMEYLTGQDLEGVLASQGPLPAAVAATYILQACEAIGEAHDAGVVHRDLKPANLFLTKRPNGSPCIKVLDFGISKSINPDEAANSMTRTTAIMGSPYYMSPEQMRSSKNVDHRTDIWALGVILYQLSTGRVPFPGETITEVCSGVLADEPMSLVALLPGIPQEFDAIVRRCLQKNPAHRFGHARELAAGLAAVAGASPGTSGLNLQVAGAATVAMQGAAPALGAITGPQQQGHQQQQGRQQQQGHITGPNQQRASLHEGPGLTQAGWGQTQPTARKSSFATIAIGAALSIGVLGGAAFFYARSTAAPASAAQTAKPDDSRTSEPAKTAAAATAVATATAPATAAALTATAAAVDSASTATATASSAPSADASVKVAAQDKRPPAGPRTTPRPPPGPAKTPPPPPASTGRSIF